MKVLVISENPDLKNLLEQQSRERWEFIQYFNPIKAMDNIDEITPDIVLFNAMDFPRHWKPFLTFLRQTRNKYETVFILMKGPLFPVTEASKAAFLGANGIIGAEITEESVQNAREIVDRYKSMHTPPDPFAEGHEEDETGGRPEYHPLQDTGKPVLRPGGTTARVGLLFAHPDSGRIVTGSVREISEEHVEFLPDRESGALEFSPGQAVRNASLRLGGDIYTADLEVDAVRDGILFSIISLREVGRERILQYILSET